jgi:hypothetical protein
MSRRSPFLIATTILVLVASALPAGASALAPPQLRWAPSAHAAAPAVRAEAATSPSFSISRSDGNDANGPLDLASMKISRGKTQDTVTFSTIGPVTNSDLDPNHGNGNFVILIDTNDDQEYEYGQYLFYAAGKLRGVLVRLRGNNVVDRTVPTSRTGPRGFRQVIQHGKIFTPGTYRFALFGVYRSTPCGQPCVDAIPNRYPLIPLDFRAPSSKWLSVIPYASDESIDLTSDVQFAFEDNKFGTGVRGWALQSRLLGGGTDWTLVKEGRGLDPIVSVAGAAGGTYELRVRLVDKQGNRSVSKVRSTTFPFDDRDVAAVYEGVTTQIDDPGAFLGTTTALEPGAKVTFTFESFVGGSRFCLVAGPSADLSTAQMRVDDDSLHPWADETTPEHHRLACDNLGAAGEHTMTLEVDPGVAALVVDGFAIGPKEDPQ